MRLLLLCTGMLMALALGSCRISYRFNDADTGNASTISVTLFDNDAAQAPAGIQQQFTESLRDLFQSQTKLDLIASGGDLQFEGAITGYTINPVNIQSNDQAALNRLTITVKVRYTNQLEEGKSFEQNFTRFADYESTRQLTDVEQELIVTIFEQITQDIFNRALSNW
jgi:hypothetical protein